MNRILEMAKLSFRALTKNFRLFPNFIIIGAPRCGTTSLYAYLITHPCVLPAIRKETVFFNFAYNKNKNWYRIFFPTISHQKNKQKKEGLKTIITGEATPSYLIHPSAPKRIAKIFPKMKIIVLLRNPIDRAFSHFHHNVELGLENFSFEEALTKENERIKNWEKRLRNKEKEQNNQNTLSYFLNLIQTKPDNLFVYSYKMSGIYENQLKRWFNFFPKEQFFIIKSEDMFSEPSRIFKQVQNFLGIPEIDIKKYGSHFSINYEHMNSKTRRFLSEYFRPHNEKLSQLLGIDFGWD